MSKWGPTGDANYLKVSRNTHLFFNNTRVSSLAQHQIPMHHLWFYVPFFDVLWNLPKYSHFLQLLAYHLWLDNRRCVFRNTRSSHLKTAQIWNVLYFLRVSYMNHPFLCKSWLLKSQSRFAGHPLFHGIATGASKVIS